MTNGYQWDFSILGQYREVLAVAVETTLEIALATVVLGALLGLLLALLRMSRLALLRYPANAFIQVVRAVPPLVLIVWFYYCLPILTGWSPAAFETAVVALSLYSASFYAEIFRAGLQSIERGYIEAGLSVGMTRWQVFRRISGPLALQNIFPPLVGQCVLVVKNTSLVGYIAVADILYQGQQISIQTFRPLEVLTVIAAMFLAIILPITALANFLEARLRVKYAQ
jgi:polar amino acid transport system permease protein